MDNMKRENDSKDEDFSVFKKSKVDGLLLIPNNGNNVKVPEIHETKENQMILKQNSGGNGCAPNEQVSVKSDEVLKVVASTNTTSPCDPKVCSPCHNKLFNIEADAAEDKGSRHTMEDASVVLLDASFDCPGKLRCAHFAIYDGHGGRLAAEYAQKNLHMNVLSAGLPRELMDRKIARKAIIDGFRSTDESLLKESASGGWHDGATAVCVWILGQTVFLANIGDAKAVVARSSSPSVEQDETTSPVCPLKAIVVTREHKAIFPNERARIQKAGGSIASNGRLQGRLEVSRAFGDRNFKKVGVISTPDVHSFELTEREHFMILGCDGLWGVFGPSDAVEFAHKHLQDGLSAKFVSRQLVKEAVRERHCKDNCTALVIIFKHN